MIWPISRHVRPSVSLRGYTIRGRGKELLVGTELMSFFWSLGMWAAPPKALGITVGLHHCHDIFHVVVFQYCGWWNHYIRHMSNVPLLLHYELDACFPSVLESVGYHTLIMCRSPYFWCIKRCCLPCTSASFWLVFMELLLTSYCQRSCVYFWDNLCNFCITAALTVLKLVAEARFGH